MTEYIWMLTADEQRLIYERLLEVGIIDEDLETALDGRVCDLEDTIDIAEWR